MSVGNDGSIDREVETRSASNDQRGNFTSNERLAREYVDKHSHALGNQSKVNIVGFAQWLDKRALSGDSSAPETSEHPDTARLKWLANTVLCSDYGDNTKSVPGWRVMEFIAPIMYGSTINEAIDTGIDDEASRRRLRIAANRAKGAQETPRKRLRDSEAAFNLGVLPTEQPENGKAE